MGQTTSQFRLHASLPILVKQYSFVKYFNILLNIKFCLCLYFFTQIDETNKNKIAETSKKNEFHNLSTIKAKWRSLGLPQLKLLSGTHCP